jgi:hypothetical protein
MTRRIFGLISIIVLGLLATGACALGGCADLQASKAMAATIDGGAVLGQKYAAATLTPATSQTFLAPADGADLLENYARSSTIDPFKYAFEANTTIFCTSKVFTDLTTDAVIAREGCNRFTTLTPAQQVDLVNKVGQFLLDVKRWKDHAPGSQ